jgi:hypothetical protein
MQKAFNRYKKTWEKNAYNIRNEAVHKGKPISESESSESIKTTADTIKFFMSLKR